MVTIERQLRASLIAVRRSHGPNARIMHSNGVRGVVCCDIGIGWGQHRWTISVLCFSMSNQLISLGDYIIWMAVKEKQGEYSLSAT